MRAGQGLPSPKGAAQSRRGHLAPQGQLLSLGRCFSFKCLIGSVFLWHEVQNSVLGLLDESLVLDSRIVCVFMLVSVSFAGFSLFGAKKLLNSWRNFTALSICVSKDVKWPQNTWDKPGAGM